MEKIDTDYKQELEKLTPSFSRCTTVTQILCTPEGDSETSLGLKFTPVSSHCSPLDNSFKH